MIADVAQIIRQVIRAALAMPANSVVPEDQLGGAGTEVQHMATVKIVEAPNIGWPSFEYANTDGTPTSTVTEDVDQLKKVMASVNFYRGGAADSAGLAQWTLRAVDDAARIGQLLRLFSNSSLLLGLGLTFVNSSQERDLTRLVGSRWKSRGQVDLTFYVVNRESDQINSIGSGTVNVKVDGQSKTIEVST